MFTTSGTDWVLLFILAMLLLLGLRVLFCRHRISSSWSREPEDRTAHHAQSFIIKPYLQLGDAASLGEGGLERVDVLAHVRLRAAENWQIQVRSSCDDNWRSPQTMHAESVDIAALEPHARLRATLTNLPAGRLFSYRLLADGAVAFAGSGKTRAGADAGYTFVVAGDLGEQHQSAQLRIASQIAAHEPDFLALAGDLVYQRGRVSEFMKNLFPAYNADIDGPTTGGGVLRSRIVMPSAGNHDMGLPNPSDRQDFSEFPDLLGYFLFWSVPLNGPYSMPGANTPVPEGDELARRRFATAAGARFPRIGNYSFDWGNSHWTVLDSNAYVDWTDAQLRAWVEADLAAAQGADWRFVMFHHPVFSSDGKHADEQRMRLLTPLFEKYNVDVVFAGHNHCYERTHPLRFQPEAMSTTLNTEECPVPGSFEIDEEYDGARVVRPNGVIYVVDGAAGAKFYVNYKPPADGLKPYTCIYDQSAHSFTFVSVTGRRLLARQINENGEEIDRYIIEK